MWKHRILAPDNWGAYQRNNFSDPQLLHPPIYRKALDSLTWDIWFSLNYLPFVAGSSNYLPFLEKLPYNLAPLLTSLSRSLRATWDVVSWAWSAQHVIQLPSHVQLFVTPQIVARQASLCPTISWSLPKFMSISSVMSFNHFILCHPLLLLHSIFPSIRVFRNDQRIRHNSQLLDYEYIYIYIYIYIYSLQTSSLDSHSALGRSNLCPNLADPNLARPGIIFSPLVDIYASLDLH